MWYIYIYSICIALIMGRMLNSNILKVTNELQSSLLVSLIGRYWDVHLLASWKVWIWTLNGCEGHVLEKKHVFSVDIFLEKIVLHNVLLFLQNIQAKSTTSVMLLKIFWFLKQLNDFCIKDITYSLVLCAINPLSQVQYRDTRLNL